MDEIRHRLHAHLLVVPHAFASDQKAIHTLKDIHVEKASHLHVDQTKHRENDHRP